MTIKKVELRLAVLSIVAGAAYTILSEIFTDAPFFDTLSYGLVFALLIEVIALLVMAISSLRDVHELMGRVSVTGDQTSSGVLNLGANIEFARNLLLNLQSVKDKILQDSYLLQRNTILGEIGIRTLQGYLADFRVSQYGFSVRGEYSALRTYIELWQQLVEEQKEVGADPSKLVIARITHSNGIRLWQPTKVPEAQALLALQREFVKFGGVIVRIFVGPTQVPTSEYRDVMESMERSGIETRYVWKESCPDFAFDFLYLHDHGIAAKWYAGAGGQILSHIELTDQPESQIKERWVSLSELTQDEEGPMSRIPEERQIWTRKSPRKLSSPLSKRLGVEFDAELGGAPNPL